MKVIVCGAGLVGASIAQQLASENNDVTVKLKNVPIFFLLLLRLV